MQPVILLTFSNDQDDYLENIVLEQKNVKKQLWNYDNNSSKILIRDVAHSSIEDIFYLINRYHNRIQFFHFGGHASGQGLQLENQIGQSQYAHAKGIAGLLGNQKALKLVFLNGCATEGQVETLLQEGVKAVIATTVPIGDTKAREFSEQFYQALSLGSTILEAFKRAKDFLEAKYEQNKIKSVKDTRGLRLRRDSKEELPWGLYLRPENEKVLHERLPTQSYHEVMIDDTVHSSGNIPQLNAALVKKVFIAIKDSPFARKLITEAKASKRKIKPQELRDAIVRSYLAPISVHLRTLFSTDFSNNYSQERLQQISVIHLRTMELIAFTMISDLWDAINRHNQPIDYTDAERVQLAAFFNLNKETYPYFNYVLLSDAIMNIFNRKGWQFYIKEFNQYPQGLSQVPTIQKAHEFLNFIKEVLEGDVPSRLIETYCVQAEEQLANLLVAFKFLVNYKLVVVKNIEVLQVRSEPSPSFKHIVVELDNNYNDQGTKDSNTELESFTDMESVLLYKDHMTQALNLSPFVIDENALTKNLNSKVYFLKYPTYESKQQVADDLNDLESLISGTTAVSNLPTLQYQFIENEEDKLSISQQRHHIVAQIFKKAKATILGEKPSNVTQEEEDDILNLID